MSIKQFFQENKYAYFSNVITKEEAKKLSDNLFKRKKEGILISDDQCPKSHAVYGDPFFDELLERLTVPLSQQIGIDLLPAYTYARLYEPGEILLRHRDRSSCQISTTMTLGYNKKSDIWPIYLQEDKNKEEGIEAIIEPGDMVLYRGNQLCHWREEYTGVWQTQVFMHYVDANGPYKDLKYDRRKNLSHKSEAVWNKIKEDQLKEVKKNKDKNRERLGTTTGPKKNIS
jgi:hypothetical protein